MLGQFGDYTLLDKLGAGDMGTTYRAQYGGQPVVLKLLDKVDSSSTFQREAAVEIIEFAATLQNPRLVPILAALDAEEKIGVVMPLFPMGSIGSLMAQGKSIPPKHGLKLIGQIASGLAFLHGQEVAHGSVKPSNILLDAEGNALLTDLSMAHLREMGLIPTTPTQEHMFFKMPEREYHATPEVMADVFSLAVLTYLLLAGKLPFAEPEPEARGIIEAGGLPPAIAAVLRRAMNPHLRLRYPDINTFMTAIRDATQGKVDPETEKVFGVNAPPPEEA